MFSFFSNTLTVKPFGNLAALALTLFVSLLFFGCGGSGNGGGDPRNLNGYVVSFYDDTLELLGTDNIAEGAIVDLDDKKSEYGVEDWYQAKSTTALGETFIPRSDINFYATQGVIEISNQAELDAMRDSLSGKYILIKDIELKATGAGFEGAQGWLPVGSPPPTPFRGILNGNGHKIRGLWINRPSGSEVGLFGRIEAGTIKNLGVEIDDNNGGIQGEERVGGISGWVQQGSTITNSYSVGSIRGTTHVGGIAGYIQISSAITNSYFVGNISGTYYAGGIAGYIKQNSRIATSYSMANISAYIGVGGIAGYVIESNINNNAAIHQEVNATSVVNRISGYVSSSNKVSNNFALSSTRIVIEGANGNAGTLKSDAELKAEMTYSDAVNGNGKGGLGWDFETIWKIDEGEGYPYLYWEDR
ncbi:MAG: hypothetical protein LBQ18_08005 [Campylobacteraceae bacterium]|jgi:hypothetical protein|nr:hypothetical protein [Campylobacteraceae bacterium]